MSLCLIRIYNVFVVPITFAWCSPVLSVAPMQLKTNNCVDASMYVNYLYPPIPLPLHLCYNVVHICLSACFSTREPRRLLHRLLAHTFPNLLIHSMLGIVATSHSIIVHIGCTHLCLPERLSIYLNLTQEAVSCFWNSIEDILAHLLLVLPTLNNRNPFA